ncbi:MAG: nucleotide pyrophosphohydrolase [Chitinophagaceae bacterium]|nr:nucleotide pyrophosphohydrolase [Chitinophagaceae bacterium]
MTLEMAQQQVDQWIRTVGVRYFSELTNMAILTEEVGELARIMARRYGDQSEKESDRDKDLGDEMADVLWVLICLANQTGINLTEALEKNFDKRISAIKTGTRTMRNCAPSGAREVWHSFFNIKTCLFVKPGIYSVIRYKFSWTAVQ